MCTTTVLAWVKIMALEFFRNGSFEIECAKSSF